MEKLMEKDTEIANLRLKYSVVQRKQAEQERELEKLKEEVRHLEEELREQEFLTRLEKETWATQSSKEAETAKRELMGEMEKQKSEWMVEMERAKAVHEDETNRLKRHIDQLTADISGQIEKAEEIRKLQDSFHDAERDQLMRQLEALTEELEDKEIELEDKDAELSESLKEHRQAQFQAQETNKQLISFYVNEMRNVTAENDRLKKELGAVSPPASNDPEEGYECTMCLDAPCTYACVPCGHMILCSECHDDPSTGIIKECYICRSHVFLTCKIRM